MQMRSNRGSNKRGSSYQSSESLRGNRSNNDYTNNGTYEDSRGNTSNSQNYLRNNQSYQSGPHSNFNRGQRGKNFNGLRGQSTNTRSRGKGAGNQRSQRYEMGNDFRSRGHERRQPPPVRCNFPEIKNMFFEMADDSYNKNLPLELGNKIEEIKIFLSDKRTLDSFDVKIIFKVLIKGSRNPVMERNFGEFLRAVLESDFAKTKLDDLVNKDLEKNVDEAVLNLLVKFMLIAFDVLPTQAKSVLGNRVKNLQYLLKEKSVPFSDDFRNLLEISSKSIPLPLISDGNKPANNDENDDESKIPPDDFREIEIYPNYNDLMGTDSEEVFLRKSKTKGLYKSVDDYLDIQFRLMREDFIQPLREGLRSYRNDSYRNNSDVRVYENTIVVRCLPTERTGIVYYLKFAIPMHKKINWSQSKRFIFGSFLCLSKDNFRTLLFATVAHRDLYDLRQGKVAVKFLNSKPEYGVRYTLIESTNMFESYRHVLVRLKETNKNYNLCFHTYLVFLAHDFVNPPKYLMENPTIQYQFKTGLSVCPMDSQATWPDPVNLNLNESQFRAFRTAITKEISIIQGPPGTGKTHVGLDICKCLLENVQQKLSDFGPILVVCYSNHALDLFLEGILEFTNKIVRVGSQSKSEVLKKFSLLNYKRQANFPDIFEGKARIRNLLDEKEIELLQTQALIENAKKGLLSIDKLQSVVTLEQENYLNRVGLKEWLLGFDFKKKEESEEKALQFIVDEIISEDLNELEKLVRKAKEEIDEESESDTEDDEDESDVHFLDNERHLDVDNLNLDEINLEYDAILSNLLTTPFMESKVSEKLFHREIQKPMKSNAILSSLEILNFEERWNLYRFWKDEYLKAKEIESLKLEEEIEDLSQQINEIYFDEDRRILAEKSVIGMTTTGAARYGRVLEQIQCKIIIIEEAAEVLESHIIGSLNAGCQQLILIGDHKQLRPSPAVHNLKLKYNLDLSLFERLINNKFPFDVLEIQHRMRPEIASLMKFIYEKLENHDMVLSYPNVTSIGTNLYFFDHSNPEKSLFDSFSYSNEFEAEMVLGLCKHLILNGHFGSHITILTLYTGQSLLVRSLMSKDEIFKGVRVSNVDNYQGEENDIIIVTLVRSNKYKKIGFLETENRICVSLSRAKRGLFVFGNFQLLESRSDMWKMIVEDLKSKGLLGNRLPLVCDNHPNKKLFVSEPKDFSKYPGGGCEELCKTRMPCGHFCKRYCHRLDMSHSTGMLSCLEDCLKKCPFGHECSGKCSDACGDCLVPRLQITEICGHEHLFPCSKIPTKTECEHPCGKLLGCGHKCVKMCKEPCEKCIEKVSRQCNVCQCTDEYFCYEEKIICKNPCLEILECGHKCGGTCGKCFAGRLHQPCSQDCPLIFFCGHKCKGKCSQECLPCTNVCDENCSDKICDSYCYELCESCSAKCKWICKHQRCTKLCSELCDRQICDEKCLRMVNCSNCKKRFMCYGLCGEHCMTECQLCNADVTEYVNANNLENSTNLKFIKLQKCGHYIEQQQLDNHMKSVVDDQRLERKRCPKCNEAITKQSCPRYSNIIHSISKNIKLIRLKFNEMNSTDFRAYEELLEKIESLNPILLELFRVLNVNNFFDCLKYGIVKVSNTFIRKACLSLDLIKEIYINLYLKHLSCNSHLSCEYDYVTECLIKLVDWLNPWVRIFNEFDLKQYCDEFRRLELLILLNTIFGENNSEFDELKGFFDELKKTVTTVSESFSSKLFEYLDSKPFERNRLDFVKIGKRTALSLVRLDSSRWFVCPEGHCYCELDKDGNKIDITKCAVCDVLRV